LFEFIFGRNVYLCDFVISLQAIAEVLAASNAYIKELYEKFDAQLVADAKEYEARLVRLQFFCLIVCLVGWLVGWLVGCFGFFRIRFLIW
jgi:hypothetical protein